MLTPGDRVWVKIPDTGYVGVAIVKEAVQSVNDFKVTTPDDLQHPAMEVPQQGNGRLADTGRGGVLRRARGELQRHRVDGECRAAAHRL